MGPDAASRLTAPPKYDCQHGSRFYKKANGRVWKWSPEANDWLLCREMTQLPCTGRAYQKLTGVTYCQKLRKFKVHIWDRQYPTYLGSYADFFEACCVRKSAEVNHETKRRKR